MNGQGTSNPVFQFILASVFQVCYKAQWFWSPSFSANNTQSLHCRMSPRCCHCVLVLLMEIFFHSFIQEFLKSQDKVSASCSKSHHSEKCWISPQPFWTCQLSLFMYCSPLCLRHWEIPGLLSDFRGLSPGMSLPQNHVSVESETGSGFPTRPFQKLQPFSGMFVLAVPKFPLPLIDGKCIIQHKQGAHMMGWRDKTDGTWVTPIRRVGDENMLLL